MRALMLTIIFAIGLLAGLFLAQAQQPGWEDLPDGVYAEQAGFDLLNVVRPVESQPGPADRIAERQIEVYGNRIVLDIQQAQWARFTDTKSMEPILHAGANAIEVVPESMDDIQVGDIVSYRHDDGWIIHRVVHKGEDERGPYLIMKGDNLPTSDPGRVRFDQVKSVVVAVIY